MRSGDARATLCGVNSEVESTDELRRLQGDVIAGLALCDAAFLREPRAVSQPYHVSAHPEAKVSREQVLQAKLPVYSRGPAFLMA
jgi:hypothetical protein